jgi:gliding motility-associated-like protein
VVVSVGTCTDTASATVSVNNNLFASAGTDVTILIGSSTTLNASGGSSYGWGPATGLSCITCQSPVATPSVTTNYCVFVSDTFGCEDSACVTVFVEENCKPIYLPNAFSPNGDGDNDVLYVYGTCIKEMKLEIYDRWGNKVYEGTKQAEGWNGIYNGKMENSAVFVYYLTYTLLSGESGSKKGNVSLIR